MNLASLDLNLLVVLDALLADGTVTGAARRVGLSQPALSNALARLRGTLGDPLFVRCGRGLVATARARELELPVRRALAELAGALAPPTRFDPASARRRFVLMMPDIAELVLIPPLSARLRKEAPGVDLHVVHGPAAPPREILSGAGAPDVIVTMIDDREREPCSAPLFALRFVCLVRRGHPRVGRRLSLARFLELEHVLVAPAGGPRGVVDELLAARGLERRVAVTLAHFFSAALVVSRTDLVMSATSVLARVVEDVLPVRSVRHPLGAPSVTIGQRWHPSHDGDPAHRWLRRAITEVGRSIPS